MAEKKSDDRRDRILDAALALLEQGGLEAVTTAALARDARCSKSTLYAEFADRDAILAALVQRQAAALNETVDRATRTDADADPRAVLIAAGEALLDLLTSDGAVAINRAALADPEGGLSRILIAAGRDRSAPRILGLIERLREAGALGFDDVREVYRAFYGLLISDRQILALHRVPGARPSKAERRQIAERAAAGIERLFPAG